MTSPARTAKSEDDEKDGDENSDDSKFKDAVAELETDKTSVHLHLLAPP